MKVTSLFPRLVTCLFTLAAAIGCIPVQGAGLWNFQASSYQSVTYNDIAFGNNLFVAVGDQGTIIYSSDGIDWDTTEPVTNRNIQAIAFGNGMFVASSSQGLIQSEDGETWSSIPTGLDQLNGIKFINGQFFALADGYIYVSADLADWDSFSIGYDYQPQSIAYGSNQYAVVGSRTTWSLVDAKGIGLTTSDPETWSPPEVIFVNNLSSIAFGNNVFVAVSPDGKSVNKTTSPDGINWTDQTGPNNRYLQDIVFDYGTFVAVGQDGILFDDPSLVLTSSDGMEWEANDPGTTKLLNAVTSGLGKFVAVGQEGNIVNIVKASDLATTPASLSQTATQGANAASQTFELLNTGTGTVNFAITASQTWVTVNPSSGSLAAGAQQTITASFQSAGLSAGQHSAALSISGGGDVPINVAVNLNINAPVSISIDPLSTTVPAAGGNSAFVVTGTGEWTAVSNESWAVITFGESGEGDGSVNFTVSANESTSDRFAVITVGDKVFTINQEGVEDTPDDGNIFHHIEPNPANGAKWTYLGWLNDSYWPWVWHYEHGFLYCVPLGDTSAWFYNIHDEVQWLYADDSYPFLYSSDLGIWLYYFEGGADRWFQNPATGEMLFLPLSQ